jgi:retron-type reverse transcriptase
MSALRGYGSRAQQRQAALNRVRQDKGSPGTDGTTADELPTYLVNHWEAIPAQLLYGSYQPKPVRRPGLPISPRKARRTPTLTRVRSLS